MNDFDKIPKELVNKLKKLYIYYGKEFPGIYEPDNVFSGDWPLINDEVYSWWGYLNYIYDKDNGTGTCMAFDYDGIKNTFKDEFIEWMFDEEIG